MSGSRNRTLPQERTSQEPRATPVPAVPLLGHSPTAPNLSGQRGVQVNRVHGQSQLRQSDEPGPGPTQGTYSGAKGDKARDRTGNHTITWVQSSSRR